MVSDKCQKLLLNFSKTIALLTEVLEKPSADRTRDRDSAIKRFEMAFDLSWKVTQAYLKEQKGVICNSPKDCFRALYHNGSIDYDNYWLAMTDLRNETIHTYNEKLAEEIFQQLPQVVTRLKNLAEKLQQK